MDKKEAYKIVLEDITEKGGFFTGKYDAVHGSEKFMYGILTVMDLIAYGAGTMNEFDNLFLKNMQESEAEALDELLEEMV